MDHYHFISFYKSHLAKQCHRMRNMSRYVIAEAAHNVEHNAVEWNGMQRFITLFK